MKGKSANSTFQIVTLPSEPMHRNKLLSNKTLMKSALYNHNMAQLLIETFSSVLNHFHCSRYLQGKVRIDPVVSWIQNEGI